jgi:hypothetical protein
MKYSSSVNNYRETPYIVSDTFANKVNYAATIKGAIYVARDGASLNEPSIYQANGTIWVPIGGYGIGTDATLQDVTTNGKTTNQGITVTAGGVSTNTLTVTSLTPKSIPFVGTADLITEDNTNLVWDNVNKWIGIQTNVPTAEVDIHTTTATPAIVINNTAGLASRIGFQNTNVSKWTIGNSATNTFNFFNSVLGSIAAYFDGADNSATFNGSVQALSAVGSRDTTVRYNGSIVDSTATISAVKAVAKFSNNGSGNITKIILSDIVNADCAITFQPSSTIANSLFGIGINASTPQLSLLGNGNVSINIIPSAFYKFLVKGNSTVGSSYGAFISAGTNASDTSFLVEPESGATTYLKITGGGNVLVATGTDDTVNKLQISGSVKATSSISYGSVKQAITSVASQDSSTINLSTIFPSITFTSNFVSLQLQIMSTDGVGFNSTIVNSTRNNNTSWSSTIVSTVGTVNVITLTFGGTTTAPTLTLSGSAFSLFSVIYSVILR